jgi:hypothetical protein
MTRNASIIGMRRSWTRAAPGSSEVGVLLGLDFVKHAVFTLGVAQRPHPRIRAAEDRDFDPAVIVDLLDAPVAGGDSILENLGA